MLAPLLLALLACTDKGGDTGPVDTGSADGGADVVLTEDGCEERHAELLAAFEAELADYGIPSASLAVMEDGVVTCRAARGHKGDGETPATVDTLFQLGSTTKMFTAVALLQKVEDGQLSLDDSLASVYPDSEFTLDEDWNDALTLQHLLTHQGSFYDYMDALASSNDAALESWYQDVFFPYLWLMTDPGWFWNYANPNFSLAGLVVEHTDGRWYADVMEDDVWGPLGMDRSYLRQDEVEADGDYALGYGYITYSATDYEIGQATSLDQVVDAANGKPAGIATWSTPTQMMQMADFLMHGDTAVLDDDLRQAMTAAQVPVTTGFLFPFRVDAYGYGVMVADTMTISETEHYDLPVWNHGGNTNMYTNDFYMLPTKDFAIDVMSAGYGTPFYDTVATAMRSLVDLPDAQEAPPWEVDTDVLDAMVGTYDDAYNIGEMIIARDGDGLDIALPFLESLGYVVTPQLEPLTTDVWLLEIDGNWYDLSFHPGPVDGEMGFLSNRLFAGSRVESGDKRAVLQPPGLPRLEQRRRQQPLPIDARIQALGEALQATRAASSARP